MTQGSLFESDLARRAKVWIATNPRGWELFCRFTREAIRAGHRHYSSDAICHRIRWHTSVETNDPDGFKINNNLTPYLAREFERIHPQHAGFFRKRSTNRRSGSLGHQIVTENARG